MVTTHARSAGSSYRRGVDRQRPLPELPEPYAAALRLRDLGYEIPAIAERLGLAPGATETLMDLAAARLARLSARNLEPCPGTEPANTRSPEASDDG